MNGINIALPAWLIGVLGMWAVSFEAGCAATLGLVIQWTLKAPKHYADYIAPLVTFLVGGGLFIFVLGHYPNEYETPQAFISALMLWVSAAIGTGSAAGSTGGAPKTNSK